jgi:Tfp pilus assembly protein PilF
MVQAGWTRASVFWAFTTKSQANWHPLTWLSHMFDCELYGLRPWGHHLSSLLIHLANVLMLMFLLRRATGSLWCSTFVAAVFAVHPLHVESVAWVAERKDVLSAFFWMLASWCYIRYVERPGMGRYVWVVLSFALGLLAKPMLVTLPFAFLLLDYWPLGRLSAAGPKDSNRTIRWDRISQLLWEKTPLFILSAVSAAVTYLAQRGFGVVASLERLPFSVRLGNALLTYVKYIGKMFWPRNLAVFYPHPGFNLSPWQVLIASLVLILVSLQVFRLWKRHAYLAVGWLWYLGTLVPVIGLVQVGRQAMADRYTYIPLIGIAIMVAWGIPELLICWPGAEKVLGRRQKTMLALCAGLVISILTGITWIQVGYWHGSGTLFEHALSMTSNNEVAHTNMGVYLQQQGKLREAVAHYSEALRIAPDFVDALNLLGSALMRVGRTEEALSCYRDSLHRNPDQPGALNDLAWYLATSETERVRNGAEAIRLATQACELTGYRDANFLGTLAAAFAEAGRFNEAAQTAQKAVGMALSSGEKELLRELREQSDLYKMRRPYREHAR